MMVQKKKKMAFIEMYCMKFLGDNVEGIQVSYNPSVVVAVVVDNNTKLFNAASDIFAYKF